MVFILARLQLGKWNVEFCDISEAHKCDKQFWAPKHIDKAELFSFSTLSVSLLFPCSLGSVPSIDAACLACSSNLAISSTRETHWVMTLTHFFCGYGEVMQKMKIPKTFKGQMKAELLRTCEQFAFLTHPQLLPNMAPECFSAVRRSGSPPSHTSWNVQWYGGTRRNACLKRRCIETRL